MTALLRIDASSRSDGSHSRALGDYLESSWRRRNPGRAVLRRDLATDPVGHIAPLTIAGFYTAPEAMTAELRKATSVSDQLIAELQAADALLLTLPMYNFGVPSALKAWIDQIVRIGRTFSYDGMNFAGLVKAREAYVVSAYGAAGYLDGGALASADFVKPYLSFLLGFLGIATVHFVGVEATTADAATVSTGLAKARAGIDTLFADI